MLEGEILLKKKDLEEIYAELKRLAGDGLYEN